MITHRVYKMLCYLTGVLNVCLVLQIMTHVIIPFSRPGSTSTLLPPCLGNLGLAFVLTFGVSQRRPAFIKLFRTFMFVQIVVLLLLVGYVLRLVVHGRDELLHQAGALCILIALFGVEALIATGGLKAVLSEPPPFEEGAVIFQRL